MRRNNSCARTTPTIGPTRPDEGIRARISLLLSALAIFASIPALQAQPFFGNGVKIGETTEDSTIIWLRLTERAHPNWEGLEWLGTEDPNYDVGLYGEKQFPEGAQMDDMEGSLPGMGGTVRLKWWPGEQRGILR